MKIVIIEDHMMMRDLVHNACARDFGHEIVAEAASAPDAVAVVLRTHPDLIILDLQIPDGDGLSVLRTIREHSEKCKVLVLSSHCSDYTVYLVEKACVNGFIDKTSSAVTEIRKALTTIANGGTYFSRHYHDARTVRRNDPSAFDKLLSEREQTVLILIGKLLTDDEAAVKLGISTATVAKHRFNILRKLGLPSTSALARYARDKGFTDATVPVYQNRIG